jgi:hypothetical protein
MQILSTEFFHKKALLKNRILFSQRMQKAIERNLLTKRRQADRYTSVGMRNVYGAQISEELKSLAMWQAVEEESSTNLVLLEQIKRTALQRLEKTVDLDGDEIETLVESLPDSVANYQYFHPLDEEDWFARPPQEELWPTARRRTKKASTARQSPVAEVPDEPAQEPESSPSVHSDHLSDQLRVDWSASSNTEKKPDISSSVSVQDASCVAALAVSPVSASEVPAAAAVPVESAEITDPPIAIAVAAENEVTPVPPIAMLATVETALAPGRPSEIVAVAQEEAAALIPSTQTAIAVVEETALAPASEVMMEPSVTVPTTAVSARSSKPSVLLSLIQTLVAAVILRVKSLRDLVSVDVTLTPLQSSESHRTAYELSTQRPVQQHGRTLWGGLMLNGLWMASDAIERSSSDDPGEPTPDVPEQSTSPKGKSKAWVQYKTGPRRYKGQKRRR